MRIIKDLIILTDNDGKFLISIADLKNYTSMDVGKLEKYFTKNGYNVSVKAFSELDFSIDYAGKYIIYETSETPGSFYKRYIEDIVFFLEKRGAIMLPRFEYLKAHHDKVYMEMMRTSFLDKALKTIKSMCFGSENEALNVPHNFPVVIKQASGSGSSGVYLATNETEYKKHIHNVSSTVFSQSIRLLLLTTIKNKMKQLLSIYFGRYAKSIKKPIYTPFVVQTFIKGLNGDYKVLVFGDKYYTLYRKNRDNDFRASGSGKLFEVPEQEHEGLLNFARKLTVEINFPILGIDIGFDGKDYHLIEFQMIHIGPYTLQASNFWHEYKNHKWIRFEGKSNLEEEFSRSINQYILSRNEV